MKNIKIGYSSNSFVFAGIWVLSLILWALCQKGEGMGVMIIPYLFLLVVLFLITSNLEQYAKVVKSTLVKNAYMNGNTSECVVSDMSRWDQLKYSRLLNFWRWENLLSRKIPVRYVLVCDNVKDPSGPPYVASVGPKTYEAFLVEVARLSQMRDNYISDTKEEADREYREDVNDWLDENLAKLS